MPTLKQKLVVKKVLENNGKSVSQAMRESGYSASTSKNPQQLTRSKGWLELMEIYVSEEKLMKVHSELLKDDNWRARAYALDKAYKLLGKYKETKLAFVNPYDDLSDEELDKKIKELEKIKQRYDESTPRSFTPGQ